MTKNPNMFFQCKGFGFYRSLALIALAFTAGCGTVNPEFTSQIKSSEYLFSETSYRLTSSNINDLEKIANDLGGDRSGYIKPDSSTSRIEFQRQFPIATAGESDYEVITGFTYNWKLGQVLSLSADIDDRTTGTLKNESGALISVSGMIDPKPNIAESSVTAGATQALAAVSPSLAIDPTKSLGSNVGMGLAAGLIAGVINAVRAEAAFKGILAAREFGSRMEASSTAIEHSVRRIDRYGLMGMPATNDYVKVAPGVVRVFFGVLGQRTLQYKNMIVLISATGVYRGQKYKELYPTTAGWEFTVTNLNYIVVGEGLSDIERFNAIRDEFTKRRLSL
jgi:hypothetical protein